MGTPSEWNAVALEIGASASPWSSTAVIRLFKLAEDDGRLALRSFADEMGDAAVLDLVRDLVTAKLTAIIAADEPRGYFWKAVVRAAISRKRRGSARVEASPEHEAPQVGDADVAERAHVARLDRAAAWARLSPREQEILSAIREGEDRDALARHWGTSRNNIDKIVSRATKRLAEEDR